MNDAPQVEPYLIFQPLSIDEAPDPPVPEEVTLENCSWMKLYGDRLMKSGLGLFASRAGLGCAILVWWYAFKEPGVSIPNDQRHVAHACGLRWTDQEWKDVKDEALDKFYLCSNGRLYHPFLSEVAIEAWEQHHKKSAAGKKGASRRWPNSDANGDAIAHPMAQHGRGEERRGEKRRGEKIDTMSGKKARRRPKAPVKEIIGYLNEKAGTAFRPDTQATIRTLDTRWKEFDNIKAYLLVIDYICANWLKDEKMAPYVRPPTIFQASKFEGYLESAWKWADKIDYTDESMKENWDGIISGDNEEDRPGPSEDVR